MKPLAVRKRKVILHGHLAQALGQSEFVLAASSPAAAVRLLEANFPGVFSGAMKDGLYQVVVGEPDRGIYCDEPFLNFQFPEGDIHFVPVLAGSGMSKGLMMAVIGVSILAIAFTGGLAAGGFALGGTSVGGAALSGGIAAGMGTSIFGTGITWGTAALFGAAVLFAGVSIMLTPTPKAADSGTTDDNSFFFNGATNTVREGVVVPLVYGRVIAGSVVVSGGLYTEKMNAASNSISPAQLVAAGRDLYWH
ncbi:MULTISPECIES: hypothetical protein [unclassified Bradyrhizobium]|uniref:hypothetical protein n=1 Tax=unclassified Bradyrhizobium TaxID=2631580 RepID=UPI00339B7336